MLLSKKPLLCKEISSKKIIVICKLSIKKSKFRNKSQNAPDKVGGNKCSEKITVAENGTQTAVSSPHNGNGYRQGDGRNNRKECVKTKSLVPFAMQNGVQGALRTARRTLYARKLV